MERTIPCDDCAQRTLDTEQLGFRVTGCKPDPTRPGFCVLTFVDGDTPQAAASGAATDTAKPSPINSAPAASPQFAKVAPLGMSVSDPGVGGVGSLGSTIGPITVTQAATAKAIVNIFETGEVLGVYGDVTLIPGDTGHLTFGRSQTTLGSGNLARLLQQYCANHGARFAARLSPYLPRFFAIDQTLDNDHKLHNVLRASADDLVMRVTQDAFFDQTYWSPAIEAAGKLGLTSPLAVVVVYDSFVQGSWLTMRDRTTQSAGAPSVIGENAWISAYISIRRSWLENNALSDLRPTVYRMDAFKRLIDQGFWRLGLPLVVRGKEISALTLAATPPGCYDGPQPGSRQLELQTPLARGLDVRMVQFGLSDRGVELLADGIFGQTSTNVVKAWQVVQGLPGTGIVDLTLIGDLTA